LKDNIAVKLRLLPAVCEAVAEVAKINKTGEIYQVDEITMAVRKVLEKARRNILNQEFEPELWNWIKNEVLAELKSQDYNLRRVINATGVILHTNFGRAILAPEVADYVARQAVSYSNLEYDTETGNRGSRYSHVEDLLVELTGAEAAVVVNNNAAAVLLIMNTLANGKEVIVSRGELVEIGGSFRIPEVIKAGGARLVEVGTTNRTWPDDYLEAVSDDTAMYLKVHTSNYRIEGFEHSVSSKELVQLGKDLHIPVVEDLGSGSLTDGTEYGLPQEPTIREAVKSGAILVSFSGDKLLGGPQAGIIVGKKEFIEKLKSNQLMRAIRVDKLTLAALIGTLRLYHKNQISKIPVWRMLSKEKTELLAEAERLQKQIAEFSSLESEVIDSASRVGGGAFPTAEIPTTVCAVNTKSQTIEKLEHFLRQGSVPIIVRIFKGKILIDPRTLLPGDETEIISRLEEWNNLNI